MSKMKQATLFSLKSWKKIAVEDLIKYKDILDNQGETEAILKTLTTLKKKNPSKDLVLSTGIDSSLIKIMETHSSSIVINEVKKLILHWKLDVSLKHPNIVEVNKKHSMSESNLEKNSNNNVKKTLAVCSKSEPLRLTNAKCVDSVSKTQPINQSSILKLCAKAEEKNKDVCNTPSFPQVCKTNTAVQVSKANAAIQVSKTNTDSQVSKTNTDSQVRKKQTPKQICKKSSLNELRKSEVTRRLHFAMKLFMEEVGKQEVKMYLEAST